MSGVLIPNVAPQIAPSQTPLYVAAKRNRRVTLSSTCKIPVPNFTDDIQIHEQITTGDVKMEDV
jgi:hypothetical protein